jgi:hypothetical protein
MIDPFGVKDGFRSGATFAKLYTHLKKQYHYYVTST